MISYSDFLVELSNILDSSDLNDEERGVLQKYSIENSDVVRFPPSNPPLSIAYHKFKNNLALYHKYVVLMGQTKSGNTEY